ncbi:serine protease snake isoform X2 [Cephus cinctus]|uniref:Serine protease snake isoform X2 n=1 Tax=Cephus cinctus TaxID=211228 RepID=A0AAJ7C0G5_CEPCN|nr:serine protease snake isoform X2 [Cephus cinctus]
MVLLLLTIIFVIGVRSQSYVGDICNLKSGAPGKCSTLENCQSVYSQLVAGNPPDTLCGFSGFEPIVCCPSSTSRPSTTTEAITTATSADESVGSIARQKCAEYSSSVYALVIPPTLIDKRPVNISVCAITSKKLIVGGTRADPKEFPHMAAVGFQKGSQEIGWFCGGTLVSERFVMTAAHCTYSAEWGKAAWVRVGDLNLVSSNDNAKPQNRRVIERIKHPEYKRPSQYHDIALLKLESPVEFNAFVRPACLHTGNTLEAQTKGVATGWGHVEWQGDGGSNDLLKVTLSLVPQSSCNESFSSGTVDSKIRFGIVGDWQICAGEVGKDTCQGDSGGPLAIFNTDHYCMYDVIGVTSFGRLCGSIVPGVYTRVSYYVPWLESIIWPQS